MLLVCLCISVSAQSDTILVDANISSTTEGVTFRVPEREKIREYQKDSRFKYDTPQEGLSAWDKFMHWLNDLFNKAFDSVSKSGAAGIILILAVLFAICLIVLKVMGIDYRKVLGKKKMDMSEIDIYTENVHEMDFDTLISNAMKNNDYRLVVRFMYLKNLKSLSDKEIISWNTNKTNYSYQHEITNTGLRSKFLETTLIFDYIWYGEFPIDESRFTDVHTRMNDFNKMITDER